MSDLVVRRVIRASAEFLFDAWTTREHLIAWWGPRPVRCTDAEIDLRVGGRYRIVNALPGGGVVTITGELVAIDRPRLLVFTWCTGGPVSRVTVRFEAQGETATEIVVTHQDIPDEDTRASHEHGWNGCLDGLDVFAVR